MNRILINALSTNQGGGVTYLKKILNYASLNNIKLTVLVTDFNKKLFEGFTGVELIINKPFFDIKIFRHLYEHFLLPFKLKKWGFDVFYSLSGNLPLVKVKGVKTVVISQNMLIFETKEQKRYPWGKSRLRLKILELIQAKSFKRADFIIFISNYARDYITKKLNLELSKSIVIPHQIEENFYKPKSDRVGNYILYVSSIFAYKSHLQVVKEAKLIEDKLRERDLKFLFIGPSEKRYINKVKKEIKNLAIEDLFEIKGEVPRKELPRYYSEAYINLFASTCENCPITLFEKMLSGRPVICSNYGPMPEFGKNGVFYFDPYARGELSRSILDVIENNTLAMEKVKLSNLLSTEYLGDMDASLTLESLFNI